MSNLAGLHLPKRVFWIFRFKQFVSTTRATSRQMPPEARYQDEFYRCCHAVAHGAVVTFLNRGWADFYIPSKKWGVELLHDGGDDLEGRYGRFTGNGKYSLLDVDDFIVLDFRTCRVGDPHFDMRLVSLGPSLCLIVFSPFGSPKSLSCRFQ
jgi:hypothetical protein